MDVLFFFRKRTRFIRLYDTAAAPFIHTMRAIEEGAPPFDNPPYSEDGEPAYLVE